MNKNLTKRLIGLIAGAVLIIVLTVMTPAKGLSHEAMVALAWLGAAIIWMICDTLPDYVAMLAMCTGWVIFKAAPTATAFATFSNNTWFLLVGALGIGAAANKSGLLKRITLLMLKVFPATHKGQYYGLIASGLVVGPLIPSTTAKGAVLGTIAGSISDTLGYKRGTRASAGIFAAFLIGTVVSAPLFLSSSIISYSALALMPEGYSVSWGQWFLYALPWNVLVIVAMTIIGRLMYKPEVQVSFSKSEVQKMYEDLGPMKKDEKITLAVLVFCLVLWMLERAIGVNAAQTACIGVCILIGVGIYGRQEFRSLIAWDSIIFIGCIISVANVFSLVGINDFISTLFAPIVTPLVQNIWIFIPVYCIAMYLMRFVVASWIGAMTIATVILLPFTSPLGIHPFVITFIGYVSVMTWNTLYQSAPYIACQVSTGNDLGKHSMMRPFSYVYMVLAILGCYACVPLWRVLGLL